MSDDEWSGAAYLLMRHLPGFGGIDDLDGLTQEQAIALLGRLRKDLEREARSWKGGG